jgi:uncharacterized protein (UPF0335 family)
MHGLSSIGPKSQNSNYIPVTTKKLAGYVDQVKKVETFDGMSIDAVFQEAEASGFDPVILRLLVRERKMSQALDNFLALRLG